ncbi:MAG: hypothetical protein CO170_01530 [candidate division SR1 bacterium CG_4_9_14_3_um_filter_40_9]|nr:MAG: hypothetical protein CO170_01530 [candidate division SR1 bacterium CG_4_9_14_3_um_filter_40_9]
MPNPMKAQEVLNILQRLGCTIIRQKGSHVILRKEEKTIIVPFHGSKDIPIPTIKSILKQGGISEEEFSK